MAQVVTLKSPEGELQAFNASDVPLLLKRNYQLASNEEIQKHNDLIDAGGFIGGAKAFGEAALSAATFGASREAANALGLTTPYEQAIRKEAHPLAAGLGTAAGIAAPIIASMGAAAPEAIAAAGAEAAAPTLLGTAGKALAAPVQAVTGLGKAITGAAEPAIQAGLGGLAESAPALTQAIARGGAGAVSGAAEGALYGLGNQIDEHALGDPEALGEHLAAGIGNGALWGSSISGALGLGAPVAKKAMESLKGTNVFKKGLSVISGVSEENIDAYMKNREAILATPEKRAFYDTALDHVQGVFDDVANKKMEVADAKTAFQRLEDQFAEKFKQNKYEAREALKEAKQIVGTALADRVNDLQKAGFDAAPKITQAVERLRENVVKQSSDAYKILEQSGKEINLRNFVEKGKELASEIRAEIDPDAEGIAKRIEDFVSLAQLNAKGAAAPESKLGAQMATLKEIEEGIIRDIGNIETQQSVLKQTDTGFTRLPGYTLAEPYLKNVMDQFSADKAEMIRLANRLKEGKALTSKQTEMYRELQSAMREEMGLVTKPKDIGFDYTPEDEAAAQAFSKALEDEKNIPYEGTLPAAKIKQMIQKLDELSRYNYNATNFDKGLSVYYKQLRYILDQDLKAAVPEYKAAMAPLAKDAELISKLKKYGEESRAIRAVNSIKSKANQLIEMPLLKELEAKTGVKFTPELEGMILTADKKALEKTLPEYADVLATGKVLNHLTNPETERAFFSALEKTPEFQRLSGAQQRFVEAELKKASLDGLTPRNIESKLNAAMRGKFNVEKAIKQLPEIEGVPMEEALQNLKVKEAFEGGKAQGSRAVNMFGALGSAIGMAGGHLVGGVGIGAAIGAYMDKYGHQAAKSIIDAYMGASERASVMANVLKQVEKNNQSIVSNAKDIFKGSIKSIPSVITKLGATDFKPEVFQHIDEVANNPEKLQQVLEANVSGVNNHIPMISMGANVTTVRAAKFLSGKVPHATTRVLSNPYKPSKSELMKFNRYYNTIQKPTSVIKKIKFGMVMPEDMEALKAVYPQLLAQMQGSVMEELADHMAQAKKIPYKTKLGLSAFLEQELTNSLAQKSIQMNQATFAAPSQQQSQGIKPTQGGMKNLSLASDMQTGFKKLSYGSEA